MFYTRLSPNFQPKSAQLSRRQLMGGGLAAWAAWQSPGIASAFAGSTNSSGADSGAAPRQKTPPMTQPITDENGAAFTLARFAGRPLLINFWASWCAPCIAEMPSLQLASERLQPAGVTVVLISVDRGGVAKALPVLRANGVTAPQLGFDPKAALSREMGVTGLPTSFLLSADHHYCQVYVGPREWHTDAMQAEMRQFLAS